MSEKEFTIRSPKEFTIRMIAHLIIFAFGGYALSGTTTIAMWVGIVGMIMYASDDFRHMFDQRGEEAGKSGAGDLPPNDRSGGQASLSTQVECRVDGRQVDDFGIGLSDEERIATA